MVGWLKAPGQKYRKFNGKTFEREEWSKSKREMKKSGEALVSGMLGCKQYRVVKKGRHYILYTR